MKPPKKPLTVDPAFAARPRPSTREGRERNLMADRLARHKEKAERFRRALERLVQAVRNGVHDPDPLLADAVRRAAQELEG